MNDSHCHFFSRTFFTALGRALPDFDAGTPDEAALARLGWDPPGAPEELADRWVNELDRHGVARAALIASVPGDGDSVARAVRRHPERLVGFFMVDPTVADAASRAAAAIDAGGLQGICLFPALHQYQLQSAVIRHIFDVAAARPGTAVFVHCGVLSIGARRKLGLPNSFDPGLGNPLDLQPLATAFPGVPLIVPHFGAGFFREALMLGDTCRNVVLDTSSSNAWMRYHPGLTLRAVFEHALAVVGPERLVFGTDSSFFPRGWVKEIYQQQVAALDALGVSPTVKDQIFKGTFDRLFPI